MHRPALRRLLDGVRARRVDAVLVYKVDRLTRSLADFARIMGVLETHGASFVSITQAFSTTTSMGRLTLNELLSFAQFEREVTGERRLRGAISFGECIVSVKGRPALLGEPTREASDWEKKQEWMGAVLAPSAVSTLKRGAAESKRINGSDWNGQYPDYLVRYDVPLKGNLGVVRQPMVALNWASGFIPGGMMWRPKIPTVPETGSVPDVVRLKIESTVEFTRFCESASPVTFADWETL